MTSLDSVGRSYRVAGTNDLVRVVMATQLEHDGTRAVVFWQEGRLLVMPATSFLDGRFEAVDSAAPANWDAAARGRYRHVKSGGVYALLAEASMARDDVPVVVYVGETGCWTRVAAEFWDGRFVRLHAGEEEEALLVS